jgi:RHS repeat-associated protein
LQQQRDSLNTEAAKGLSNVQTQAETMGRALFAQQVNDSSISNNQYVTNLYEAFLQRGPDTGGLNFWSSQANVGQGRQNVLNAFATCPPFKELAGTLYREANWLVTDHLGTPRMVVNKSGALSGVTRHDNLPFGEELGANIGGRTTAQGYTGDSIRQKFTAKERDIETGLDYFEARYYAGTQGRFTSTDPILITADRLIDPQEINLYHYARNNPLRFTDPTGEDIDDSSLNDNKDYQKWKTALLATKAGQAQWDKYANDHSINITITMGENTGGKYGAETTSTFDSNGKLIGASIVLGTKFAEKAAAAGDYPIGSKLTSDDPNGGYSVSREARAVFFLSHEFGHVEDAQKVGGAVWGRENALLTENLAGFKKQGQAWFNSSDYQKLLTQCGCKNLNEIHGQRELRAEGYAIPTMKDYYAKHAGHGSMPKRVKQAIQNYGKAHPQ